MEQYKITPATFIMVNTIRMIQNTPKIKIKVNIIPGSTYYRLLCNINRE